jgi:hypothetical protein
VRREGEHVECAGGQAGLHLVLVVRQVPVLRDGRPADHLRADSDVILDPRGLRNLAEQLGDEDVETMPANLHPLPLRWRG